MLLGCVPGNRRRVRAPTSATSLLRTPNCQEHNTVAILSTISSGRVTQRVLATPRVGLKSVILPRHNEKDLDDLPVEVREGMDFILVDTMDKVLKAALGDGFDRAVCE